jgi:hypothetical protein
MQIAGVCENGHTSKQLPKHVCLHRMGCDAKHARQVSWAFPGATDRSPVAICVVAVLRLRRAEPARQGRPGLCQAGADPHTALPGPRQRQHVARRDPRDPRVRSFSNSDAPRPLPPFVPGPPGPRAPAPRQSPREPNHASIRRHLDSLAYARPREHS